MPSDDYTPLVRGGLKLKGSKPSGILKGKKKKKAASKDMGTEEGVSARKDADAESALQTALKDKDARVGDREEGEKEGKGLSEGQLRELEIRGDDGKTASERQYEEMRRRRVCSHPLPFPS